MKQYIVREPITKTVICKGTAAQCAERLCYKNANVFRNNVLKQRDGQFKKYLIEEVTEIKDEGWRAEAIRKWDEFTEPLRKEFGILRYGEKRK